MPSLKPIHAALAVALALGAAGQSLLPASAQVFRSRMDQGKKECEGKHGTFKQDNPTSPTSDTYTCTYANKIDSCVASTGKCTTKEMPAPKPAAAAPAKSLAGTGNVSKDELKKVCAKNKAWMFSEEKSGAYSCLDSAAGIAINCKNKNDCTEAHTPVHAR
jgi:hypothetical protein